ncbi:MAG: Mut7-C RNAse domain-containing protein [Candidatus Micrarchaeia archaeon]
MRRLAADVMLAKLARWLRLGGVSIEDVPNASDARIISFVRRRKALLLTSDKQLALRSKKQRFRVLLVEHSDIEHQLAYTSEALGLKLNETPNKICPECNGRLKKTSNKRLLGRVPKHALESNNEFYICSKCGRIYWKGTHWKRISLRFKRVNKLACKKAKSSI